MSQFPDQSAFEAIKAGFDPDPNRALSLRKEAYVDAQWFAVDRAGILAKSWQWVCHVEKLRTPGSYVATRIAGHPIAVVREMAVHIDHFKQVASCIRVSFMQIEKLHREVQDQSNL